VGIEHRRRTDASHLLDLAYDAIFAIDAESHEICYWNAGAERMYGYSREEALGRVSQSLLKTRFPDGRQISFEPVIQAGTWEGRLLQTRKDGSEAHVECKWALDPGSSLILEVNREVTQRVLLAERFQLLVESVKDYAIFLLDAQGRVSTWNMGAERIKGYEQHEIIGRHYSVFYPEDAREEGIPELHLQLAAEAGSVAYEGWRLRKDGTRFWAEVVLTALFDGSGQLIGFAKVTRDMTQKQLERQRLEELERAKSTFLNLVAHELRSPLTVLRGYVSLFREADPAMLQALAQESLPALEAKTIEMTRLVDQMVEIARLEEGTMELRTERFDMTATVDRAVEAARALDDGAHHITAEPFAQELNAVGDEQRLTMILNNLLSNAIKYSPEGGHIAVSVSRTGAMGRVTVVDQGVGISPEDRPRLFSPFTRVNRDNLKYVPGTGMGLYLSRELARRQGGDVLLVRSGPDGSEFAVTVPLNE
jgi:PAS domain S-box-containing protein